MAEIRVEPKRRSLAWLWIIIVLLIIAALVYYFLYYRGTPAATTTTTTLLERGLRALAAHGVIGGTDASLALRLAA